MKFQMVLCLNPLTCIHSTLSFINIAHVSFSRYNSGTGKFTVPRGSAGLYFFSMHFVTANGKQVDLQIYRNHEKLCGVYADINETDYDNGAGSCSVTVELNAG